MRWLGIFLTACLCRSCEGFASVVSAPKRSSLRKKQIPTTTSARRRPEDEITLIPLETEDGPSLVTACTYSETFPCGEQERLAVTQERIMYRNGRVDSSTMEWIPHSGRPVPHLYNTTLHRNRQVNDTDLVIDKNGYAWRAEHVLRENGLRRSNMEATHELWRPLRETEIPPNDATEEQPQMPIPWYGPFNLPPQERGTGFNRRLRDDLQFGCELDDERWLVYFTKLAAYSARFGNVNVPLDWNEDESLGRWVFKQRVLYRRYVDNQYYQHEVLKNGEFGRKIIPLSPWRIQMLYDLGFSFKINLNWSDRYAQLKTFKETFGHVRVKSSDQGEFAGLHSWVQTQRTEYRRFKHNMATTMTQPRFLALDSLGLDWDPTASTWGARLEDLRQYREEHGHSRVRKSHNPELAAWLVYQRAQYRLFDKTPWESTLTQEKIDELEQLGMDWNPLETRWQERFRALEAFRQESGHCNVPVEYAQDPALALWVQRQRRDFREKTITPERQARLESIGFEFQPYDEAFSRGLGKLESYRTEYGDCRVPKTFADKELVSFVVQQRKQFRLLQEGQKSSLTEDRKERLENLGFDWSVRANVWEENFGKLQKFHDEFGHCNVPSNYKDQELYGFVSVQRSQYKRLQAGESQRMTRDRIKKLEELGFAWNTNDARWMERLTELGEFKKEHGHCNVPDKYPQLGSWVRNQRVQYRNLKSNKKSTMTPVRLNMLQELGFEWSVRKMKPTSAVK